MSIRSRSFLVLCLFSVLCLLSASAPARAQAPPPAHETSAEVSFVGTSGNSSTESVGIGLSRLDHIDGWVITGKANYVQNSSFGDVKAESLVLAFQGAKTLTPKLSVIGKYGFLHDRFAGIESRNTVGLGAAYIVFVNSANKLTADGSFGYASEERTISPTTKSATWDMGLVYWLKLSENADILDEPRMVFSLADGKDWRAGNNFSVSAKLTTIFSLKMSNTVRYVNTPVPGFQKTDTTTAVALVAKF